MPTRARVYIRAVIVVGAVTLLAAMLAPWGSEPLRFACLGLLALTGGGLKVRLPGLAGNISLSFVFVLFGTAVLSLPQTMLIACAATAVQCLCRTAHRQSAVQIGFNISSVAISTAVAYWGPRLLFPGSGTDLWLAALALAATLYFVCNTLLVSTVLALIQQQTIRRVWIQCHLWSFPYYGLGAGVAALVTRSTNSIGWRPSMVVLPLMYLVYQSYRQVVERLAAGVLSSS